VTDRVIPFPLGFVEDFVEASLDSEKTWQMREGNGGEETAAEERGGGRAGVVRTAD
jgi:hypothetical protein